MKVDCFGVGSQRMPTSSVPMGLGRCRVPNASIGRLASGAPGTVTRVTLAELVEGEVAVSPQMAEPMAENVEIESGCIHKI